LARRQPRDHTGSEGQRGGDVGGRHRHRLRAGAGPALILVDAAGRSRELGSFGGLIGRLAADFTVYHYDRRGRGGSTDTAPYAVEREVQDLAALIERAGGAALLYGFSSGGLLAVHAAAGGLPIPKLALLEPPIAPDAERPAQQAFTAALAALVAAGRREAAVEHYLTGIGVPDERSSAACAGRRLGRRWWPSRTPWSTTAW
jgi:pimeloyl-ACP methyl ester carboxylesterase